MTLHSRFADEIDIILDALEAGGELPAGLDRRGVAVEPPRDPSHGELATNAAMVLAKPSRRSPRELAVLIAPKLEELQGVAAAEIAGPGFINLRLSADVWRDELRTILTEGDRYGRSTLGAGERVDVEYVSANPTGPMHMGHCRGAVVGDALANLLDWAGWDVTREYYVNDAGSQVDTLARSAHLRYAEALGRDIGAIPEGYYPGDYLVPVGEALAAEFGGQFLDAPEAAWLAIFKARSVGMMLDLIRDDLALLGIHHDVFVSEAALQAAGEVDAAFAALEDMGLIYQGVLDKPKGDAAEDWEPRPQALFRSSDFGDDADRALRKSDGSWTYLAGDVAYHRDKLRRGYPQLINLLGADHGGYVKRIQAVVSALSDKTVQLDCRLVQMVRLFRAGEPVKMSKRAGTFVTLADVVREVGKDVVRFIMLTRRSDAQLDFDFAKVVEASRDNPVFYVQYAHARSHSLGRRAAEAGIAVAGEADLALLSSDELALVQLAAQFPRIVETAAIAHEPHRIAFYLGDLAAAFHAHWNSGNDDPSRRFVDPARPALTQARLALARGIGQVINNGLAIIGVAAVEEMQ